jgi:heme/copper-type cytochrome/quinol oxidase subunit 2
MNQPPAEIIFWIAAAACAIAQIIILRSTFAARRTKQSDLVPVASRGGEMAWAVIPALALAVVLVATWQRIEAMDVHHSGMRHTMPMPAAP